MANAPIDDSLLFLSDQSVNWEQLRDFMKHCGKLTKAQCKRLLEMAKSEFKLEPNLIKVSEPLCVVGDIHGQYYDLLNLLERIGKPGPKQNFLFLGDYVDRGVYGVECCLLLFALKLCFPKNFVVLRGNHESRAMTETFSFRQECLTQYDEEVYELFMEVFDTIPITALIENKYIAMHGGISPKLESFADIEQLDRF